MQNFSEKEIKQRLCHHKELASQYMLLFNEDISKCEIALTTGKEDYTIPVQIGNKHVADELKKFFYEMSAHHINERIKWEIALYNLAPDTVGK